MRIALHLLCLLGSCTALCLGAFGRNDAREIVLNSRLRRTTSESNVVSIRSVQHSIQALRILRQPTAFCLVACAPEPNHHSDHPGHSEHPDHPVHPEHPMWVFICTHIGTRMTVEKCFWNRDDPSAGEDEKVMRRNLAAVKHRLVVIQPDLVLVAGKGLTDVEKRSWEKC